MDHATLMSTIKEMQRSDASAKEQWWAYCDTEGNGVRDPAKHQAAFLQNFISLHSSGQLQGKAQQLLGKMPAPGDFDGLVTYIKGMQRNDVSAKTQWWAYCDAQGEGKHDPTNHDASFLMNFITQHNAGIKFEEAGGSNWADFFKDLQRNSSSFKEAWGAYADTYGGSKRDPTKQSKDFMLKFIDSISKQGLASLSVGFGGAAALMAPQQGGGMLVPTKRPGMMFQEPAAKKQRTMMAMAGMGMGMGMGMPGMAFGGMPAKANDPKSKLVDKIKTYQRSDATNKENWWAFCDTQLGGVRDPAKHDLSTLKSFVTSYGVP